MESVKDIPVVGGVINFFWQLSLMVLQIYVNILKLTFNIATNITSWFLEMIKSVLQSAIGFLDEAIQQTKQYENRVAEFIIKILVTLQEVLSYPIKSIKTTFQTG
ncbi:hypothetical protein PPYR_04607 [Photinus pyralis]|uniref:Uncharacterized protein n=1 Tax=Photinus pyralis TaxID=7054 RepID=A0A5N4AYI5_PHOPY|nr:hypothetical protein PPYR_04607 [Photinus pyralis]